MARKHIFVSPDAFERMSSAHQPDELAVLMSLVPLADAPQDNFGDDIKEAVREAVASLPSKHMRVITLLIGEQMSLRAAGDELGYSDVHIMRMRDAAFNALRDKLSMNPLVRRRYSMAKTWGQSAGQWCGYLGSLSGESGELDFALLRDRIDSIIGATFHNNLEPSAGQYTNIATPVISYLRSLGNWDSGQMSALLQAKQHDYGHKNIDRFGSKGIVVRLNDKYERLVNLEFTKQFLADGKVIDPKVNESHIDTLVDIVGYCVIGLMVIDETFQLKLGEPYES